MHNLDLKRMGSRIRQRREELNLSREQLAEAIGVSSKFISDIECGTRGVSLKTLISISDTPHLSTDFMLLGNTVAINEQIFIPILEKCPPSKREHLVLIIREIINSYQD